MLAFGVGGEVAEDVEETPDSFHLRERKKSDIMKSVIKKSAVKKSVIEKYVIKKSVINKSVICVTSKRKPM